MEKATQTEKTKKMRAIRDEVVNLKESPLYKHRVLPVIGEGNHDADIMFVGEAPGKNESEQGRPFCGRAGKVLDELLASINIARKNVYITNLLKDRPPSNRDPLPEEITLYGPFLDRQIEVIQPKVIVPLGRFSMRYIFDKFGLRDEKRTISQIHGTAFRAQAPWGEIVILPLYHPAVATYNPNMKTVLLEDFKKLKKLSV